MELEQAVHCQEINAQTLDHDKECPVRHEASDRDCPWDRPHELRGRFPQVLKNRGASVMSSFFSCFLALFGFPLVFLILSYKSAPESRWVSQQGILKTATKN